MCRFADVYIPKGGKYNPSIPDAPNGLVISVGTAFQTNFAALHKQDDGILASLHDGHCLCNYKDWSILFDYLESIRTTNKLDKVEFLLYWSDDVYPLTDRIIFAVGIDTIKERPVEGMIYEITTSIPRRLEMHTGKQVYLSFKSGKNVKGILQSYSKEGGNGTIQSDTTSETVYFHDKEISQIEGSD